MKKPNFLLIFLSFLLLFSASRVIHAQVNNGFQEDDETTPAQRNRADILQQLDLSNQQLNQIRIINQQFRPLVRQSNQRLQAANQALDEAIYSNQANDSVIQSRLRNAQDEHAEWIKNRTKLESEISRVLNPGQLARFRQFRVQNKLYNQRNRRLNNQNQPVQRINRVPRQIINRRPLRRNN